MSTAAAARAELGDSPGGTGSAGPTPFLATPGGGRFAFTIAAPEDDLELRRLLRESPLPGEISLSFEREPNAALAASIEGDVHQTIVARDRATGGIAGVGSRSVRTMFVNGRETRIGYLGQLRIARGCRHIRSLLDGGFAFCRALHERGDAAIYLTSLIEDNEAARRLLVDRRSGTAPRFTPIDRLTTFVIPTRQRSRPAAGRGLRVCTGSPALAGEISACLERNLRRYQFAPCWSDGAPGQALTAPGLSPEDFVVAVRDGRVVGCLALWDQRAFKQVVVRGYGSRLRRARPFLNMAAGLLGTPHLPTVGQQLPFAYLSHVATDDDRQDLLDPLVAAQVAKARERRLDYVVTAFPDRHAFQPVVRRRWRHRAYSSVIYATYWPDGEALVRSLDGRPAQPEAAVL